MSEELRDDSGFGCFALALVWIASLVAAVFAGVWLAGGFR